jgi:oxygen-dependent protoporphyrinogen oxidase
LTSDRHVIIIGAGIAGLAAAHELLVRPDAPRVTVLEADHRVGGKISTTPFAGLVAVDEGADAFLARVPWATAFARRLGLDDHLVSPTSGHAAVWWDELHRIPPGLLLGMPTDIVALARSRLLSWPGKLRAAVEPLLGRTSLEPDSLGQYVRARFGSEVHHRLVDPLVGSIYAADTDHFSLAAVPQIAELARRSRSVLVAARRRGQPPSGPVFYTPDGGMGSLVDAAAAAVTAAGGVIRTGQLVRRIEADGAAWRVDDERADAVVLACPAAATARLLQPLALDATAPLRRIPTADVVLITMAVPRGDWPERLHGMSGYLVPKPRQRLVTAVSFGSQKWAHWGTGDHEILRISLGRDGLPVLHLGDDALVAAAVDDVGRQLGIDLRPIEVRVSRWPGAFPQYRPHHAELVASVEASLPAGLALAGASYHGIGIPACIRSGEESASRVSRLLSTMPH